MVSSRPIITSENKGPVRGWLVMGHFLNPDVIETLKKQTGVNFKIWSVGQDTLPNNEEAVLHQIGKENKYYIKEQNDDKLYVYTTVPDINGNTALLLKAVFKRDITAKGQKTVRFAMLSITAVGAVILFVLLLLLNSLIVKPLGKLTVHMKKIGKSEDFSERLVLKRNDEIGVMANEFDNMVKQVQVKNKDLNVQNQQLQQALEEIKTLQGIIPICASCKKIRDYEGYWNQIEGYIQKHSEAEFSHGICPECSKKLYPDLCEDK